MGILRADRVSGLGGANAINGSVFFGTSDDTAVGRGLIVSNTSDLDIGTGNFTIEYWFNTSQTSATGYAGVGVATWDYDGSSSTTSFNIYHYYKGIRIFNRISSGFTKILDNSNNWSTDTWHHFAWVREGTGSSENKAYIDGTQIGSAFTNAADYTTGQDWLIGANNFSGFPNYGFSGYISNVRVSNVARYTANFTAPTTRFEKDANTILLACQSPGNVLQEATGKIITAGSTTGNDYGLPVASHFTPDIGEDHGITFEDNTKFDTLSYMVPPGGTSAESNRGRGLIGNVGGEFSNGIHYVQIQTSGVSVNFGDLSNDKRRESVVCSSTRGLFAGGDAPSGGSEINAIEYVTIATTGQNGLDFGDLTAASGMGSGCSSQTRGVIALGYDHPTAVNSIDYVTIATTGNAADFGDSTDARNNSSSLSSPTRGIWAGGTPSYKDTIDYVTIASAGNATDFGDFDRNVMTPAGASSSTRGVFCAGGANMSPNQFANNRMEYITIASTGNTVHFGDLQHKRGNASGLSNSTTAVIAGGCTDNGGSTATNAMEFITIASTGNGVEFGDTTATCLRTQGTSDSHGGLS